METKLTNDEFFEALEKSIKEGNLETSILAVIGILNNQNWDGDENAILNCLNEAHARYFKSEVNESDFFVAMSQIIAKGFIER